MGEELVCNLTALRTTLMVLPNRCPIGEIWNNKTGAVDYLFARFIEPHQVLQCNKAGHCFEVASTSNAAYFDALVEKHQLEGIHLATNAVRISRRHYGALMHVMRKGKRDERQYMSIPYLIEAKHPYAIVGVGRKPLELPKPEGVPFHFFFTNALNWVDGKLLISYGFDDIEPRFYLATVDEVFGNIEPIR